jgi:hypothetical protein
MMTSLGLSHKSRRWVADAGEAGIGIGLFWANVALGLDQIGSRARPSARTLRRRSRDEALPQHVLHRLPETEVYAERGRGHQLR